MSAWLYVFICTAICIIIFLLVKLFLIKKSMKEIKIQLHSILKADTNNILTISSSDDDIKKLADSLNTELKELRKQRLQYEMGNQELKECITNISHDLRTPLTAISGYIDLIKNNKEKNKQVDYLDIIERKTSDVILLTEQLFNFSKTIDEGIKIDKKTYCINELLEESLANYYIIFKEHCIIPNVHIVERKIYRCVDKNTIIRVFENILSNVIKYSNGEFKVILDEKGNISFSNKASSLDATTVEKIFNRYYTVENANKSTGIGLNIAKQLIELNDGKINAKYIKDTIYINIELK